MRGQAGLGDHGRIRRCCWNSEVLYLTLISRCAEFCWVHSIVAYGSSLSWVLDRTVDPSPVQCHAQWRSLGHGTMYILCSVFQVFNFTDECIQHIVNKQCTKFCANGEASRNDRNILHVYNSSKTTIISIFSEPKEKIWAHLLAMSANSHPFVLHGHVLLCHLFLPKRVRLAGCGCTPSPWNFLLAFPWNSISTYLFQQYSLRICLG